MKLYFVSIESLNWPRLWLVVGTVAIVWGGIATLVPPRYHGPVMTVLSAVQAGITFAMRAGKYVQDRQEIPPPDEEL